MQRAAKRRKRDISRPFFHGSVKPYFGDATFCSASLQKKGRNISPNCPSSGGKSDCSMQAGMPARMAALLTKMLRRVERLMQYTDDGDGFRRLLVEDYVRVDWNRIETDGKFISLSTELWMYPQTIAHVLYIA